MNGERQFETMLYLGDGSTVPITLREDAAGLLHLVRIRHEHRRRIVIDGVPHCRRGHAVSGANVIAGPGKYTTCRACKRSNRMRSGT